jgi:hypothetical protein
MSGARPLAATGDIMSRPIFTSSWFTRLLPGYVRIGISRGTPRGQRAGYRMYRALAPGFDFSNIDVDTYDTMYSDQLAALDPERVVRDLHKLADGLQPVLLCFEKPEVSDASWCHRGQVAAWLWDTVGVQVIEVGMEEQGCGACHPKLHSADRAALPQSE